MARDLWLDAHGAHGAFQHFRIPIHFLIFRGRKGKANWPLLVRRKSFSNFSERNLVFVSLMSSCQVLQSKPWDSNTCYRYPSPKIPPRLFHSIFHPEPGTRIPPLHGGRVESSPSQASTSPAGIPTSHAWAEKNQGTSGRWEELREFNPHHWVTPQAGPTRRWADHLPAIFQLGEETKRIHPRTTSTRRLTTIQRTVSAASSKQGSACRFPALRSKCKERVDRWKPRGSFFKPPGDAVTQSRTLLRSWRNINAHPNHDFVLQAGLAT